MSLQLAAQHIQQHGRNGDSMLVHMSPNEVQSLNTLAKAHGGQLTTNPHTGLPEAGFLSSILPSIVGFGLNAAFPGLGAIGSGLITGGLSMALNPKGGLMGGLMAGMGAYGGAGLGDALAKTGMEEATQAELAKNTAYQQAQTTAQQQAAQLAANPVMTNTTGAIDAFTPSATQLTPEQYAARAREITAPLNQMAGATADRVAVDSGFGAPGLTTSTAGNRMGTALEGIKTLGSESGRGAFMNNIGGGMGLAKYGLAAATPAIDESIKQSNEVPTTATDKDLGRRYTFNAGQTEPTPQADSLGREKRYFTPSYNVIGDDQAKGVYGYADGGDIPTPGEPTQYSYDPIAQTYNKIEPPSNSQARSISSSANAQRSGKGPSPMSDAAFTAQQSQGEANANALGMQGMSPMQMALTALVPGMMALQALTGMSSSGQATGPASSPGEAASSSTGSGNQAGKALAISAAPNGEASSAPSGESPGAAPGGGDARGGYIANHHFDQRHLAMADGGPIQSLSDLEYQNTGVARMAMGGLPQYNLGGYSDGGRLLRGPGDGVSDSIPATIGEKQPARLADGEFVVPARIVSELGNGSTEAGARKLYAMMDRVQKARGQTVGQGNVAKNSRAEKYLPA
jgi:hypothetical protein